MIKQKTISSEPLHADNAARLGDAGVRKGEHPDALDVEQGGLEAINTVQAGLLLACDAADIHLAYGGQFQFVDQGQGDEAGLGGGVDHHAERPLAVDLGV